MAGPPRGSGPRNGRLVRPFAFPQPRAVRQTPLAPFEDASATRPATGPARAPKPATRRPRTNGGDAFAAPIEACARDRSVGGVGVGGRGRRDRGGHRALRAPTFAPAQERLRRRRRETRHRLRGAFAGGRRRARRPARSSRRAASPAPHALNALASAWRPRVRARPSKPVRRADAAPSSVRVGRARGGWGASASLRSARAPAESADAAGVAPARRSGVPSKTPCFQRSRACVASFSNGRGRGARRHARRRSAPRASAVGEFARTRRRRRSRRRGGRGRRPRRRKKFAHFRANRLVRRETRRLSAAPPTGANGRSERARTRCVATRAMRRARTIKKFRCAGSRAKYSFQRVRKKTMRCRARDRRALTWSPTTISGGGGGGRPGKNFAGVVDSAKKRD